jgi:hypothetical protein
MVIAELISKGKRAELKTCNFARKVVKLRRRFKDEFGN